MTNAYYTLGQELDFTGLSLKITYNNDETNIETITGNDIKSALSGDKPLIKIDSVNATASGKSVITGTGTTVTADIDYHTATSITATLPQSSYEHGNDIELNGTITITYTGAGPGDSTKTEQMQDALANNIVSISDRAVTDNKIVADVKKPIITFIYEADKKLTYDLTVPIDDPIVSIEIATEAEKKPKREYENGDLLDLTGGKLRAIKKSGEAISDLIDMAENPKVTIDKTNATIAGCGTNTWNKDDGSGIAGNEKVTVTYTPDLSKPETKFTIEYEILVNDKIDSIIVKTQINSGVKNKLGTEKESLKLTGATLEVTTASGKKINPPINITASMLSGTYDKDSTEAQNIEVTYMGKKTSTGAGLDITLKDYITGITVIDPGNLTAGYGLDPDYSTVKFTVDYKSGKHSSQKDTTALGTVTGYNKTPDKSKFTTAHKYVQTVTVTYTQAEDGAIDEIPATGTFKVTTIDTVTGITVAQNPNTTYNYEEKFNNLGGALAPVYASGAVSATGISMANSNVTITDGTVTVTGNDFTITGQNADWPKLKPSADSFTNMKATVTLNIVYKDPVSGVVSTTTLPVTVKDILESLSITSPKNEFNHGDTFTVGTGTILATFESGKSETINESDLSFVEKDTTNEPNMEPDESSFNTTTNSLTKQVVGSYTLGTVTASANPYTITINNPIKKVELDSTAMPNTAFNINDPIVPMTGKLKVWRNATPEKSPASVTILPEWIETGTLTTDTETPEAGRQAKINYPNYSTPIYYTYHVTDNTNDVTGIEICTGDDAPKAKLKYDTTFTPTGKIKVKTVGDPTGNSNIVSIVTVTENDDAGSPVDMTNLSKRNLKVTYTDSKGNKHYATYEAQVQDYVIGVKITPEKLTGDAKTPFATLFTNNSAKIKVVYAKTGEVELTDETVKTAIITALAGEYKDNSLTQTVTAVNAYTDNDVNSFTKEDKFDVTAKVKLTDITTGIEITGTPTKDQDYNKPINLGDAKVIIKTASNPTGGEPVAIDPAWIKEIDASGNVTGDYDNTILGEREVLIDYPGNTGDKPKITIHVKTEVASVVITPSPYNAGIVGEDLDTIFGKQSFTYTISYKGTTDTTTGTLNKDWYISGFDPSKTTKQTVNFGILDTFEHSKTKDTNVSGSIEMTLIAESVTGIEICKDDDKPTAVLQYGKDLVKSGKILVKTNKNTAGKKVAIETAWVYEADGTTPFNKDVAPGTRTLTVVYTDGDGVDHQAQYTVTVKDYITSVVSDPALITGNCGTEFETLMTGVKFKANYAYTSTPMEITDSTEIAGILAQIKADYDKTDAEAQEITFNYTDNDVNSYTKGTSITGNTTIDLEDAITGIAIEGTIPEEQTYGQAINLGTAKLKLTYGSGKDEPAKTINPAWIKEIDETGAVTGLYDNTEIGRRKVVVEYPDFTGTKLEFYVYVKTEVESVVISPNTINTAVVGTTLDEIFTDNTFTYTINYKGSVTPQTGTLNKDWLSSTTPYSSTSLAAQSLKFDITDNCTDSKTKDSEVSGTLTIRLQADSVTGIAISTVDAPNGILQYGKDWVQSGKILIKTVGNTDGIPTDIDPAWVYEENGTTPFNKNAAPGPRTLTVVYTDGDGNKHSAQYEVTVKDYVESVVTDPAVITGNCGTEFETLMAGVKFKANYAYQATPIEITDTDSIDAMLAQIKGDYDKTASSAQPITFDYTDTDTNSFTNGQTIGGDTTISLTDVTGGITLNGTVPEEQTYGENIDLGGVKLTVTKGSGSTEDITIDPSWVKEINPKTGAVTGSYDNTIVGPRKVKVVYDGKEVEFNIYVKDYVTKVEAVPATKIGYIGNEISDVITGVKYKVTYKSGHTETEDLEETMTTDTLDSTTSGTKTLTFTVPDTYEHSKTNGQDLTQKATLTVTIQADTVTGIAIKTMPEEDQKYNTDLDVGSGEVTLTMASGNPQTVAINPAWVKELDGTDYDNTIISRRQVQIEYPGLTEKPKFYVNVKNYVTGITANPATYTGNCGTEFETLVNGITFTLNYANITSKDLTDTTEINALIAEMKNGHSEKEYKDAYNKNTVAEQTLTFNYTDTDTANWLSGTPVEGSIKVKLTDVITNVTIKVTPNSNQKYNVDFVVGNGKLEVTTASDPSNPQEVTILKEWIKEIDQTTLTVTGPYDKTKTGTRKVKVVYPDAPSFDLPAFEITVEDYITDYEISKPTNNVYHIGDQVEDRDGYITPNKASGTPGTPIPLNDPDVELEYDTTTEGTKTVTIKYKGEVVGDFTIVVTDGIESIRMGTMPKQDYLYGEALSTKTPDGTQDATVFVKKFSDTAEKEILLKDCTLSTFDPKYIDGPQTITVTYNGDNTKTTSFTVTVKDYVEKLGIKAPTKDSYPKGATIADLDLTGGEVWQIMASKAEKNKTSIISSMITKFDSSKEGTTNIEVTYGIPVPMTVTFPVQIVDTVKNIYLVSGPDKSTYKYGEELILDGAKIAIEKESGTEEIKVDKAMISGYDKTNVSGEQEIIVTYEGKVVGTFKVTVEDYIKGLEIILPKKAYKVGEDLDLTGAKVKVVKASGAIEDEAELTLSMFDESTQYDKTKVGTQTLKVNYGAYSGTVDVTVSKPGTGSTTRISLDKGPDKTSYKVGEELDLTGARIKIEKGSTTSYVAVTSEMVTGYDKNKVGVQTITVTYRGTQMSFNVTVEKEEEKPQEPVTPVIPEEPARPVEPSKPVTPNKPVSKPSNKPVVSTPVEQPVQTPAEEKPVEVQKPANTPVQETKQPEKPTAVLGAKDEKTEDNDSKTRLLAISGAAFALLLLLALISARRNTKIYIEEDNEFKLVGREKLTDKKLTIDLDKYLDDENKNAKVKIVLNDSISEKLNGQKLEIIHKNITNTYKIKYAEEPFEIIIK